MRRRRSVSGQFEGLFQPGATEKTLKVTQVMQNAKQETKTLRVQHDATGAMGYCSAHSLESSQPRARSNNGTECVLSGSLTQQTM
jgi:hypothetical protein